MSAKVAVRDASQRMVEPGSSTAAPAAVVMAVLVAMAPVLVVQLRVVLMRGGSDRTTSLSRRFPVLVAETWKLTMSPEK